MAVMPEITVTIGSCRTCKHWGEPSEDGEGDLLDVRRCMRVVQF